MINLAEWNSLNGIEKSGIKCIKSLVNLISDHFLVMLISPRGF